MYSFVRLYIMFVAIFPAELVMHQERVERHSNGISTTLNEFKTRFQVMIEEHNDEVWDFSLKFTH